MFRTLLDFFFGTKIDERFVPMRDGTLKIILKERNNEKYVFMRFSYVGNIQYHALHKETIDETIQALSDYRNQL